MAPEMWKITMTNIFSIICIWFEFGGIKMLHIEKIKYLFEFMKLLRDGTYTGDAVILKSMFGRFEPSSEIEGFIKSISNHPPDYSDVDFANVPNGSFGAAYGKFMIQQGLKPFRFSGKYNDLMSRNYLPIFYASIHDFFHVLNGKAAKLVLSMNFREEFRKPLQEVRLRYQITPTVLEEIKFSS
jgi:hypothetical protein